MEFSIKKSINSPIKPKIYIFLVLKREIKTFTFTLLLSLSLDIIHITIVGGNKIVIIKAQKLSQGKQNKCENHS